MIKRNFVLGLVVLSFILGGCFGPSTPHEEFGANRSEFVQAEFELLTAGCKYDRKANRIECIQTNAEHALRLTGLVEEYVRTGEKLLAFDRANRRVFLTRVERRVVESKVGNAKVMRSSLSGLARS